MKNIQICVIGAGRWGKNHIRTLHKLGVLGGVVDLDIDRMEDLKNTYPNLFFFKKLQDAFNQGFDGYIIATPPITHPKLAKAVILENKPVLIEKPLSLSLVEAEEIKLVLKKNSKLMVGHVLLFHPAIIKMKEIINDGLIGNIQYLYSNRLNLGVVRQQENVFWSLAPHDISLFQFFIESFPLEVQSSGGIYLQNKIHDTTITYLKYINGVQGHIYVSWLHPFKEHRLVIIGSKGSLHFEDSINKLLFYEKVNNPNSNSLTLKNKPSKIIDYEISKPLTNELKYFIDIIKGKKVDKAKFEEGLDVVKILELASKSLSNKSKSILTSNI
jgi:UDP-2-acetamido-3-amino-2,3-dideoxy-glucuronate N-acetyltransferase